MCYFLLCSLHHYMYGVCRFIISEIKISYRDDCFTIVPQLIYYYTNMLFWRLFNCTGIWFSTNYNLLPYHTIVRQNFDLARIFKIKCHQKCFDTVLDTSDLGRQCWVLWETAASGSLRPNINALRGLYGVN